MGDKITNIPHIRFKGFTDDWEQRKLGDMVVRVTRKNKDLESTLPLTISAQDGLIDQNEFFNKTIASSDVSGYYLVKNGEFAYNKSYSKGYPWGAVKRLDRYEMGVLSTLYIVFKPTDIDSDFLSKYYDGDNWHKEVSKHAAEGARNHGLLNIAASDFFETKLIIPLSKSEQKQIGVLFKNLDNLITLHQRKLELLKVTKKSMLQKMFPKDGESVPEIRFAGFTDAWEQRKLSVIADLTSSKRVHAEDYVESGIPFYRGKEISELREHKQVSEVLYITEEKYEKISKLYGSPKLGDLLITAVGTIGNTWVVDNLPFYFKDGNLIWFKNIKCNSKYLDFVLSSTDGQKKIMDSAIGSNQKALTMVKLNELHFMFPKEAEQEKLAEYFSNLDNLITLHQRKLDLLKDLKKSMLQQMFI